MTDQSAMLIAPVPALHLLVRARLPENPTFADEITSKDWFIDAQRFPAVAGSEAAIRVTAVFDAMNTLYREVVHHRIRLRGTSKDSLPVDIDASDQAIGDFDIWERTLDCSADGEQRIYSNVWLFEEDVRRIIDPQSVATPPMKQATVSAILAESKAVYDEAEAANAPPPISDDWRRWCAPD